ncbi:MATE family efflux transporter [Candidatus Woesearchaeota archaeon]|nr:MATE family efflux transporter [Candidatus Woesearchaeota archaeon]
MNLKSFGLNQKLIRHLPKLHRMTEKNRVDEFIKNPKKALFTIALPIIIAMMVQTAYNIVDTAFVGRLGAEAIAALTFSFPLFFILIALNSGLGAGMGSLISRFLGAKKKDDAENTAIHGLFISIGLALIIFLVGNLVMEPMFNLFGATKEVLPLSVGYMRIILIGVFFMFPSFMINHFFISQGDTKTPMKIQITSLVINIILDPIFIYYLGFGVRGAAMATVISFFIGLVIYIYTLRKKSYLKLTTKSFSFSPKIIKEMFTVGAPATVMMLLMSLYIIFLNRYLSHFGVDYVAAAGMAFRLESVAIMPIVAFSIGTLTLVGMFFGAKRYDLLKSIVWFAISRAVLFTTLIGVVFFLFPKLFLRIFTPDQNLLSLGAPYLRIDTLTFPLMAVGMIISRAMQGMGYGLPGLIINLVRTVLVAIPLGYIFVFVLGFGYLSVAWSMVIGGATANIVAIIWLGHKIRKLNNE